MSASRKTALITGASSGIGLEFARIHAEQGGDLILVARRLDLLDALKKELETNHSANVTVIAMDLSQTNAAQALFDAVQEQGLTVDYLINNAGLGGIGKFHQMEQSVIDAQLTVNMMALTQLTRLFLTSLVAQGGGRILNVSSTASLMPGPLQAVYFATKAYVTSFSNALNQELRSTGVTVTNLMPGPTASEFGAVSGMDKTPLFDKVATAREVAQDGYDAMLRGDLDVISGVPAAQKILLPLTRLLPKRTVLKMVHRMQRTVR